jgi:Phosphotransferase enzyme family
VISLGSVIGTGVRSTVHAMGTDLVVKVPLAGTPDIWIRREAEYSAVVRAMGLPVPEVHDLTMHEGRLVVVYARIPGPTMWSCIARNVSSAPVMGELLASLHLQVLALVGPMALPRQYDRLASKIRASSGHLGVSPDLAGSRLPDPSRPLRLCHGDLHPGNVILSDDGPVLLDWFDASRGVPLADVARSSILMGAGGVADASMPHLVPYDRRAARALHDSYLAAMGDGLSSFDAEELAFWVRLEAAARMSEGVPLDDLLVLWSAPGA